MNAWCVTVLLSCLCCVDGIACRRNAATQTNGSILTADETNGTSKAQHMVLGTGDEPFLGTDMSVTPDMGRENCPWSIPSDFVPPPYPPVPNPFVSSTPSDIVTIAVTYEGEKPRKTDDRARIAEFLAIVAMFEFVQGWVTPNARDWIWVLNVEAKSSALPSIGLNTEEGETVILGKSGRILGVCNQHQLSTWIRENFGKSPANE